MKKRLCAAVAAGMIMMSGTFVFAQDDSGQHQMAQVKAVDVGNKICPVSGEKIDEKTKATYEYKGKIYNFCCPMCIETFKKDPQKYIKKVEMEMMQGVSSSKDHGMHGSHHH